VGVDPLVASLAPYITQLPVLVTISFVIVANVKT